MKLSAVVLSCVLFLALSSTASAITWNVPADALTIQAGIDSAAAGDTVLVACGTYYEHSITMKSGITLRSETGLPDCVTIDAQQLGRVLYGDSLDVTTRIEGLTITGGLATGDGGGMLLCSSSPTITDCTLSGNRASNGGGMYLSDSSPTITDCTLSGNVGSGGGIVLYESSPTITGCTLSGNVGGALDIIRSSPTITGCTLSGNLNAVYGSGMYLSESSPTITDCALSGNSGIYGAGMYLSSSSPTITGCTLSGNSAATEGGGMYLLGSSPTITGCTLSGNGSGRGGGMYLEDSHPVLENTIIAFTIWGETVFCCDGGTLTLSCCDVYGNAWGDWVGCIAEQEETNGNFSLDPLLCDPDNGDFHVYDGSSCANAPGCGLVGAQGVGCSWAGFQSISDVGNDQGRNVRVRWGRAPHDVPQSGYTITSYTLWRRIDPLTLRNGNLRAEEIRSGKGYPPGEWEYVSSVSASGEHDYTTVSPTLCDSTIADGMCWSVFFVRAYTDDPFTYFDSAPDSGYSVDNLEPEAPQNLAAEMDKRQVILGWDPSPEEDFNYYTIYRGGAGVARGEIIGHSTTPDYTDDELPGPGMYRYNITATDFAGNESTTSAAVRVRIMRWPELIQFGLGRVSPNPFNVTTQITYSIPDGAEPSRMVLKIYDATGREVRTLVDEERGPGTCGVVWDGRDRNGAEVASGVYFYRIAWNGKSETTRMVLLK